MKIELNETSPIVRLRISKDTHEINDDSYTPPFHCRGCYMCVASFLNGALAYSKLAR